MSYQKFIIIFGLFLAIYIIFISLKFQLTYPSLVLIVNPKSITPVSIIYPVLQFKEFIQSKFIFGDEDTCYWYLTLADKRIKEAQIFHQYNLTSATNYQINQASLYQAKATLLIEDLKNKTNINYLIDKNTSTQEHIKLVK